MEGVQDVLHGVGPVGGDGGVIPGFDGLEKIDQVRLHLHELQVGRVVEAFPVSVDLVDGDMAVLAEDMEDGVVDVVNVRKFEFRGIHGRAVEVGKDMIVKGPIGLF